MSTEPGHGLYEKTYQKAVAVALKKRGLNFEEQLYVPIFFEGEKVGINYFDYLVEGKVVVELKKGDIFVKAQIDQVYNYLCAKDLRLGILAYFGPQRLHYKTVLNVRS